MKSTDSLKMIYTDIFSNLFSMKFIRSDENFHFRMQDLKRKVGKEWKDFGRCLGISDAELDHFQEDNNKNVEEAIYQMLLSWKKKSGATATYANLEEALVRSKGQMLPEDSLGRSRGKGNAFCRNSEIYVDTHSTKDFILYRYKNVSKCHHLILKTGTAP